MFRILKHLWFRFSEALSAVVTTVIFSLLFFTVIGIAHLVSLFFKKEKRIKSFWKEKVFTEPTLDNMEKQF